MSFIFLTGENLLKSSILYEVVVRFSRIMGKISGLFEGLLLG